MKLKVNRNISPVTLNEADVDQGFRIKAIEKISAAVGPAITKAKYKYKPVSHTGFYILPDFGYLSKLKIKSVGESADAIFNISVNDIFAQPLKINGKEVNQANIKYENLLEVSDDIGIAMAKTLISPASFTNTNENLQEDIILEYGPFSTVINAFKNVKDKVDDVIAKKSADRSERKSVEVILNGINETLCDGLNLAIKELLQGGKQYVKIQSKVANNELIIKLKCDFVVAVTFNADPKDSRKVVVSKLLTPLGEVKVKGKSLSETFELIGKVLNIDFTDAFKVEDKSLIDLKKGSSETEDTAADDDESKLSATDDESDASIDKSRDDNASRVDNASWESLIGADAFAALIVADESKINSTQPVLNEAYKLSIPSDNYMNALEKIKHEDAAAALVRYYLYKETSGALTESDAKKINDKFIFDILSIIRENKTFNPNINIELLYILNFIKRNKEITSMAIALAENLPDSCKEAKIIDNKDGILYSTTLFNTSGDVNVLAAIILYWYKATAFSKKYLSQLTDKQKKELVDVFDLPKSILKIPASEIGKLKKAIFTEGESNGNARRFRPVPILKEIAKYITKSFSNPDKYKNQSNDKSDITDNELEAEINNLNDNTSIDYLNLSQDELKELKAEDISKIIKGSIDIIKNNTNIKDDIIKSIIDLLKNNQ